MSKVVCPICENETNASATQCPVCHSPLAGWDIAAQRARQEHYLRQIRANTSYPTLRALIGSLTVVFGLTAFSVLVYGVWCVGEHDWFGTGLAFFTGISGFLVAMAMRESMLILIDIADTLIERNARDLAG